MRDKIINSAIIPTHSLFQIEEHISDKLDGNISKLIATSSTQSKIAKEEMTYPWLVYKIYGTPHLSINYDVSRCDTMFSLPMAVEISRKYGIWECWVQELWLYFDESKYGKNIYRFISKKATKGSDAEKFLFNRYSSYLRKKKISDFIKIIPRRHLALVTAHPIGEPKLRLDEYIIYDLKFISWLNRETLGLVHKKTMKLDARNSYVDVDISEVST